MPELVLTRVATKCTPATLYSALEQAWGQLMPGDQCTRASLLVLVSHWALETGFGHACWNWNLGNIKHVSGDGHDFVMVRLNEVVDGNTVWYDPPDPATWLRAYPSLEAGVVDYLSRLRAEFRAAWPSVIAGDCAGFCHALKLARYYTDDEASYTAAVLRCYHQLDASLPVVEDVAPELVGAHDTEPPDGAA